MRLKKGDQVVLVNGRGVEAFSRIEILKEGRIDFFVEDTRKHSFPSHPIVMGQGILKGYRADWIVEKATELGVSAIFFVEMEHSIRSAKDAEKRIPRWRRLACSALKQSGQFFLPKIEVFSSFTQFLETIDKEALTFYFHPHGNTKDFFSTLMGISSLSARQHIYLLLGPEGGFQEKEIQKLTQTNYKSISFGRYILRGETAALTAASIVQQWVSFLGSSR